MQEEKQQESEKDMIWVLRGGNENKVIYSSRLRWKTEKYQRKLWVKHERVVNLSYEPYENLYKRNGHQAVEKYSVNEAHQG